MSSFRRIFKPTFDEKLKDSLYLYHLLLCSKEKRNCNTCANSYTIETYVVGGVKDFITECELNKLEGYSKDYCDDYDPDDPGYEEGNCADNSEAHDHICDHDDLVSSDLSTCRISRVGVRYCTDPISV